MDGTVLSNPPRIHLLDGNVVLLLPLAAPSEGLSLSVVHNARARALRIREVVGFVPEEAGWAGLAFAADLAAEVEKGPGRIEVHQGGEVIATHDLPDPAAPVLGMIGGVEDYCLTGWAADWRGHDLPGGVLLLDGQAVADVPPPTLHHPLHRHATRRGCAGFRVPLPEAALDGDIHDLALRFGACTLRGIDWRADPCCGLGTATREGLGLWFLDRALPDGPVTINVVAGGKVLAKGLTGVHGDLQREGRRVIGFSMPVRMPDGRVELRAGENAQLHFATLHVSSTNAALGSMRRAAAELRALQIEIGPVAGWPRDLLQDMRRQAGLAQALPPRVVGQIEGCGRRVSVIVPVYKGLAETEACIASLRNSIAAGDGIIAEVLLIDDCSPEPGMATLLAAHAGPCGHAMIRVLRNETNLGFVGSINRGFAEALADADVLLLNSDTVVPPSLARRLRRAAYSRDDIASVTPLSNDATILSLPDRDGANRMGVAQAMRLDELLQKAGRRPVDVPVGVGFCFYIKRVALNDVGGFGPEWQRGYCEEVDWCLRAADRGWTHVAAADTLVLHHGSASFGSEERTAALARNHALLEQRYPEYMEAVRVFQSADPLSDLRVDGFCALLAAAGQPLVLHFTHAYGGGTAVLVERLAEALAGSGHANLICAREPDEWLGEAVFTLRWREGGTKLRVAEDRIAEVVARLGVAAPDMQTRVHSLTGVGPHVRDVLALPGMRWRVHVHDYQWYCPRVVLVDHTALYCGEPETRYCQLCVRAGSFYDFAADDVLIRTDLDAWIAANRALLAGAERVEAPSHDTAKRLRQRLDLANVVVMPHPEPVSEGRITRAPDRDRVLRIALLGGISPQKGMAVLRDLGMYIDATRAPVRLTVIGEVAEPEEFEEIGCITITGPYQRHEAARLLGRVDPHFVFFPAVWPETYSFTLSECWVAGYPAVAFDIGAIAERIKATGAGVVLPLQTDAASLLDRLRAACAATGALHGHRFRIADA